MSDEDRFLRDPNPSIDGFRDYIAKLGIYKLTYNYPCMNCNNCIVQVDSNLKEHWACLRKSSMKCDDATLDKLYRELKYVPHDLSDTEIEFFKAFSTYPYNTCPGHSGHSK